jgi:AcrR family transcriptional regulator
MDPDPGPDPSERTGLLLHPQTPRSLRVRSSALQATRELLREGGLGAATIDAIAGRSGVS